MEREKEISKLLNVLHRIARSAHYAGWNTAAADAPRFCARQYNAVLARLTELEPQVAHAFAPLAEESSPQVTRIAARELAAYFEGEAEEPAVLWAYAGGCGSRHQRRGWGARGTWSGKHGRCG